MNKVFSKCTLLFLLVTGIIFISIYINTQDCINETGLIWYQKYFLFNKTLFSAPKEAFDTFFREILTDTRNDIYSLLLSPVYFLFKNSYKAYVYALFFTSYIPFVFCFYTFLSKYFFKIEENNKNFKYIILSIIIGTPLYWWIFLVGYPDLLSFAIFIVAMILFFKNPFDKKIPFKNLAIFSTLLYLSFLYRRWFLFVVLSFLISAAIALTVKNLADKNLSKQEKINALKATASNICISGIIFSSLIFFLQTNIFLSFFNSEYQSAFTDYKVSLYENLKIVFSFLNIPLCFFAISALIYSAKKHTFQILFASLNLIVFFLVFNQINIICYDHMMIIMFWLITLIFFGIYRIYSICPNKKSKTIFTLLVLFLFGLNFYDNLLGNNPEKYAYMTARNNLTPYKIPDYDKIKKIESHLKNKIYNDSTFTYSIWAFEEHVFNPQIIFWQGDDYKYFEKGVFPPLMDEEALVIANWYFFPIINANEIYTTEPLELYANKENSKILYKTVELLNNKKGFGAGYEKSDEIIELSEGKKVIKFVKTRPLTKQEQDDYKKFIIQMYPQSEKYFPDYHKEIYKEEKQIFPK